MTHGKEEPGGNMNGTPPLKPYAPGNTREDGSYRVGKNRPPEHSRYRKSDDRPRGRRAKGQPNFDTEFEAEGRRMITVREGGKERRVTKSRGTIIRAFDSALTKGDPRSASLVFNHASRIDEKRSRSGPRLPPVDDEELNAWLRERAAMIDCSESEPDQPAGDADPPGEPEGDNR